MLTVDTTACTNASGHISQILLGSRFQRGSRPADGSPEIPSAEVERDE
ncbi:MAG TPA: hypothetical protein PK867_02415 [Pirellulales bacterium]|nr:hypothetical protein [Pirellulales bacterium]